MPKKESKTKTYDTECQDQNAKGISYSMFVCCYDVLCLSRIMNLKNVYF
jgi:hypothetical protein